MENSYSIIKTQFSLLSLHSLFGFAQKLVPPSTPTLTTLGCVCVHVQLDLYKRLREGRGQATWLES